MRAVNDSERQIFVYVLLVKIFKNREVKWIAIKKRCFVNTRQTSNF